jgi:hypothetical protein
MRLPGSAWCFGGWNQIDAFLRKRLSRDITFYKFHTGTFFEVIPTTRGRFGLECNLVSMM